MNQKEIEQMNTASCAICLISNSNCQSCGFFQYKNRTPTIISTRICRDVDQREFVVADVSEGDDCLPYGVILYYLDDRALPATLYHATHDDEQAALSHIDELAGDERLTINQMNDAVELFANYPYDCTPCDNPVIDIDNINEIEY